MIIKLELVTRHALFADCNCDFFLLEYEAIYNIFEINLAFMPERNFLRPFSLFYF